MHAIMPIKCHIKKLTFHQDYDDLVGSVQDFVAKLMKPWLEDQDNGTKKPPKRFSQRPEVLKRFQAAFRHQLDLVNASYYPETDEDILSALILRYLWDNVIETNLYGCIPNYINHLEVIESSLMTTVEPKRGEYHALLYQSPRAPSFGMSEQELTRRIKTYFLFVAGKPKHTAP